MQHVMGNKKSGYIDKFLKKADKAIQEEVKKRKRNIAKKRNCKNQRRNISCKESDLKH